MRVICVHRRRNRSARIGSLTGCCMQCALGTVSLTNFFPSSSSLGWGRWFQYLGRAKRRRGKRRTPGWREREEVMDGSIHQASNASISVHASIHASIHRLIGRPTCSPTYAAQPVPCCENLVSGGRAVVRVGDLFCERTNRKCCRPVRPPDARPSPKVSHLLAQALVKTYIYIYIYIYT